MTNRMKLFGAVGLSVLLCLSACGNKASVSVSVSEPEKSVGSISADDLNYDALYEANEGHALLERHNSVEYEVSTVTDYESDGKTPVLSKETWSLYKDGEQYVLQKNMENGQCLVYANGTCYFEDASQDRKHPKLGKGWFMDWVYDEYINTGVRDFLISGTSEEDFDEVEEKDGNFYVLSYVGTLDEERYYYRYVVDGESLEIQSYEAVIMKNVNDRDEEEIVAWGKVSYDKKKSLPGFVARIDGSKAKERRIKINVILEDGKRNPPVVCTIPGDVFLITGLWDGYGAFRDEAGEDIFDDSTTPVNEKGLYPDVECFVKHVEQP